MQYFPNLNIAFSTHPVATVNVPVFSILPVCSGTIPLKQICFGFIVSSIYKINPPRLLAKSIDL